MSRQIFLVIVIVCVVIFGAVWYTHRSKAHAVNGGEFVVREQPADSAKANGGAPQTASSPQTAGTEQPAQTQEAGIAADAQADGGVLAPPAKESISRDPPNGMAYAGTGKYQVYRQGDITWRLDTDTGQACILFATDAEWRKRRVFQHGCGS